MDAKTKLKIFDWLVTSFIFAIFLLFVLCQTKPTIDTFSSYLALALSIFTPYVGLIRPKCLQKPRLSFKSEVQPSPPIPKSDKNYSWFLRLIIVNDGLTPAKKCVGRLIKICDNDKKRFDRFNPFNLFWSRQNALNDFKPIDIQGNGDYDILDVAQVTEEEEDNNLITLRIVMPGGRLVNDSNVGKGEKLPPGIYHVLIGIYTEDDTYIKPTEFTINCPNNVSTINPPKFDLKTP